ncbi:MAG: alpha/beta hydrolase [Gammaproteobacteria bacterium]|nr:alpha/beta hydrolase [Gammaproteobacteria bacterium]
MRYRIITLKPPLNHDKLSVRLFNEIYNNGLNAIASASTLDIPLLIAHGDADAITSAKASEEFANACPTAILKIWPGLRHETHNEHNKDKVIRFYVNWVADQLAKQH